MLGVLFPFLVGLADGAIPTFWLLPYLKVDPQAAALGQAMNSELKVEAMEVRASPASGGC